MLQQATGVSKAKSSENPKCNAKEYPTKHITGMVNLDVYAAKGDECAYQDERNAQDNRCKWPEEAYGKCCTCGVSARKTARKRCAQVVGSVKVERGAFSAKERLNHPIDEGRFDPEQGGNAERLRGRKPTKENKNPGECVPDKRVIGRL